MSRRIVMGGHRAERRIADIGEEVVVGYVAGADQLDPRLVEAALDELFHEDRALTGRHKYKHGVGRVVLHPLQKRRKVRVLERYADLFRNRAALLLERIGKPSLGIDSGSVVGDDGDRFLDPVLDRPLGHRRRGLRQRERGADDIGRLLGDHCCRGGADDFGNLRLRGDRRRCQRERREPETHQHLGVIVADQLLGQALGDVGRAGVVLDLEDDLLAGDRVTVLLHVELSAGALLLAGRRLLAGHRQDHAYGHDIVVRVSGLREQQRGQRGAEHRESHHQPFSSRSALCWPTYDHRMSGR